eukprot:6275029-Pyramimonas_sp.AAC.1
MLHYRDKLALDPETVEALDGLPHSCKGPPDIELRECAIINVIAANMINEGATPTGEQPLAIAVQEEGLRFRKEARRCCRRRRSRRVS